MTVCQMKLVQLPMVKEEDELGWERGGARRIIQKARIYPIFSANQLDYQDKIMERKTKSKDAQEKNLSTIEKKNALGLSSQQMREWR